MGCCVEEGQVMKVNICFIGNQTENCFMNGAPIKGDVLRRLTIPQQHHHTIPPPYWSVNNTTLRPISHYHLIVFTVHGQNASWTVNFSAHEQGRRDVTSDITAAHARDCTSTDSAHNYTPRTVATGFGKARRKLHTLV